MKPNEKNSHIKNSFSNARSLPRDPSHRKCKVFIGGSYSYKWIHQLNHFHRCSLDCNYLFTSLARAVQIIPISKHLSDFPSMVTLAQSLVAIVRFLLLSKDTYQKSVNEVEVGKYGEHFVWLPPSTLFAFVLGKISQPSQSKFELQFLLFHFLSVQYLSFQYVVSPCF